jgi:hypothetical protein
MNLPSCTRCLLGIYMLILMVLFAGMITGAVFAGKSDGLEVIKAPMLTSLKSYDPSTLEDNTEQAWDGMQIAVSEYWVLRKSVPSYWAVSIVGRRSEIRGPPTLSAKKVDPPPLSKILLLTRKSTKIGKKLTKS